MLINAGARIKNGPHHPNSMGVQFVQIGSDPAAATSLPKLIQADTGVGSIRQIMGHALIHRTFDAEYGRYSALAWSRYIVSRQVGEDSLRWTSP